LGFLWKNIIFRISSFFSHFSHEISKNLGFSTSILTYSEKNIFLLEEMFCNFFTQKGETATQRLKIETTGFSFDPNFYPKMPEQSAV
jgi:hypothetical protein